METQIESRINSWESLSDVVCAPAVDDPTIYYIYRKNGQEVEIKLSKHAYSNKFDIISSHKLTQEEDEYINNIIEKYNLHKTMRPKKYNQTLLNAVKKLHLSGCSGVEISKLLNVPRSSISHFKTADYCFETYLKNQREKTEFYSKFKKL